MKPRHALVPLAALAIALAAPLPASEQPGSAGTSADKSAGEIVQLPDFVVDASKFVHTLPVRTRVAKEGFKPGDEIKIVSVRGDRSQLEPGGTYLVQGTYTLKSTPNGLVALSLTAKERGAKTAWTRKQVARIATGSGEFSLIATMAATGEFHVSFYFPPAAASTGPQPASARTDPAPGGANAAPGGVAPPPAQATDPRRILSSGAHGGIYFRDR